MLLQQEWIHLEGTERGSPLNAAAPVRCSWKDIDRSLAASRHQQGQSKYFDTQFYYYHFDCQGNSQGVGIFARAFTLARPGVASPLHGRYRYVSNTINFKKRNLWNFLSCAAAASAFSEIEINTVGPSA